jgi:ubiquinone/menaquinone biosynthesis C-methylase UbiE
MSWRDFWNGNHAIYVNHKHKLVHSRIILQDMKPFIKQNDRVLDFGCGEAPLAGELSQLCDLTLCDGAQTIVDRLKPFHKIFLPEELDTIADKSFDTIFIISVLQYLSPEDLHLRLNDFKRLLAPKGAIYLADIIPENVGMMTDTVSLLKMSLQHGFFIAALKGLVKTALSPYRALRASLGLSKYDELEICAILTAHGFKPMREARNIGAHQHRYTVKATL